MAFYYSRKREIYYIVSVLLVSLFLFAGCASSPTTEIKNSEPDVTITADNHPVIFYSYFIKGDQIGNL